MTQLRTQLIKDLRRRRFIRITLLVHLRDLSRHPAKARTSLALRRTLKDWDPDIVAYLNPNLETTGGLAGMRLLERTESASQREHDLRNAASYCTFSSCKFIISLFDMRMPCIVLVGTDERHGGQVSQSMIGPGPGPLQHHSAHQLRVSLKAPLLDPEIQKVYIIQASSTRVLITVGIALRASAE